MSFVYPWFLALGVVAAVGLVALHLLSTKRPPARPLPTARFVPESDLRAVSRTSQPTDLLLLVLRVLAVLLTATAFAQPIPDAPGPSLRRIVAMEWTTALGDRDAVRARVQSLLGEGDALVVFDSAARVLPGAELETFQAPTVRAASLSPMLVALRDAALEIARGADSLAVTVVSALPAEAWDEATAALRAEWPGRIELERVEAAVDSAANVAMQVLPSDAEDPVVAAVAILAGSVNAAPSREVRIRRGAAIAEDSAWLSQRAGAVLLVWPRDREASLSADGVFATNGSEATFVAPLARLSLHDSDARVIARWRDGAPAATERAMGQGCVREIGVGLPENGDVALREPFLRMLTVLTEACGGRRSASPADSVLAVLAGDGPLASAANFERDGKASTLLPWLLAAALLLLMAEQLLRRRQAEPRQ